MKKLFLLALLALGCNGAYAAQSCLIGINLINYEYVDTCVTDTDWHTTYTDIYSYSANLQSDLGNMDVWCAQGFDGTYFSNSANCGGQGGPFYP